MYQIRPPSLIANPNTQTHSLQYASLEDPYIDPAYSTPSNRTDPSAYNPEVEQLIDPAGAVRGLGGRLWTGMAGESLLANYSRSKSQTLQVRDVTSLVYYDDAPASTRSLRTQDGISTLVLETAYSLTGRPFKTGAASPTDGFDNTTFVNYVYSQSGFKLSQKGPKEIVGSGKAITKDELRPGDLLVYHDPKNQSQYLLGIYSGNGNFLLASSRLGLVTETAAFGIDYGPYFVGGRRFYDDPSAQPLPEAMKMAVTNGAVKLALSELDDRPSVAPKAAPAKKKKSPAKKKSTRNKKKSSKKSNTSKKK
jgi:hypothetical protein